MGTQFTGDVELTCGHMLYFDTAVPTKGQEVWCRRCQEMQKVHTAYKGETYRVKCDVCRYGKSFGTGRIAAERAMVRHRMKRGMHHEMRLLDAQHNVLWKLEANQVETLELPDF